MLFFQSSIDCDDLEDGEPSQTQTRRPILNGNIIIKDISPVS